MKRYCLSFSQQIPFAVDKNDVDLATESEIDKNNLLFKYFVFGFDVFHCDEKVTKYNFRLT